MKFIKVHTISIIFIILGFMSLPTPASSSIRENQVEGNPWKVSGGYSFKWNIPISDDPWDNNSELLLEINSVELDTFPQISWDLNGDISQKIELFGTGEQWTLIHEDVVLAQFFPDLESYNQSTIATSNKIFILPLNLESPLISFKNAIQGLYNDTAWNITTNTNTLYYKAVNGTNILEKIEISFNKLGILQEYNKTNSNGTIISRMILKSSYDPNEAIQDVILGVVFIGIGAVIMGLIYVVRKKVRKASENFENSEQNHDSQISENNN